MGAIEGLLCPRIVPVADTGDVLPDLSGDPSDRIRAVASNNPVAFALLDPTAGAAFVSVLPTCNRCNWRGCAEFVADSTDSGGLGGRGWVSKAGGRSAVLTTLGGRGENWADTTDGARGTGDSGSDVPEPLNADNRRRKSSKGAPVEP